MADELYQIMVIYSLYQPSLVYFTDILHAKIGRFLMYFEQTANYAFFSRKETTKSALKNMHDRKLGKVSCFFFCVDKSFEHFCIHPAKTDASEKRGSNSVNGSSMERRLIHSLRWDLSFHLTCVKPWRLLRQVSARSAVLWLLLTRSRQDFFFFFF